MVANIGQSNCNSLDAMKRQTHKTTFSFRLHLRTSRQKAARRVAREDPMAGG
ncbi:hypothetical protein X765_32075 [Mesorhizobium sp. LSHC440B00]|nr:MULTISPECIES: hypothetical protein [unclassified Mesorhizobium]ESX19206.1 hypothetical protein X765_32075 [Mesorhizobium sp. LSHC440B00]